MTIRTLCSDQGAEKNEEEKRVLWISQNFIMVRFTAFERNKRNQILKIASISPKCLTYTTLSFSLSLCLIFFLH